ncbi:enoyl-CoA hydratase/isomerase family protein [Piscinibacter koreensis]|uniref:Enoyl-CoA hydratase/isomerase family protein n=1 Tax=Piscinibacter koreensis TaxID=2742824 RepID=A0A7Y6TXM6_9BURK|nr:enoyl-CoA hydratase/isomerase family protein [Schlegelella koreensis]NUZ07294.1 enoyl-CoA hydratase/isomerase family protein [Schlegelella koreensis]
MSEQLKIEQDGRLLRVTLNRPSDNGISDAMAAEFSAAILKAHETSDAVLLRSCGPDFCTGRVRDPGMPPPAAEAYARRPEYNAIFDSYKAMRSSQVPVIGVLEGRVMGFGTAIAALCDVSFASDAATFNIPEITHNVMPTMVMSALYDRVNRNAILWMAYGADFIDAERAMALGIVSTVVPAAGLDAEVQRFCDVLLSRPRPAILGLKEYLRVAPRMDEQGAIDYARSLHSIVNTSAEMKKKH